MVDRGVHIAIGNNDEVVFLIAGGVKVDRLCLNNGDWCSDQPN